MSRFIMSIDQGTTGTTVSIINSVGKVKAKVNHEFPQIFPKPGWVEHNPEEIWDSVLKGIRRSMDEAGISGEQIAAIGITNQRETTVVWERSTGKAIYNAIVWQCRRTTDICQNLKKKSGLAQKFKRKTGLVLDPYFSGTKFKWILDHIKGSRGRAKKGELAGGTIDSYLVWRLTAGKSHVTDVSNASRTLLMDLKSLNWDKTLMKELGVPGEILPKIVPSSGVVGVTKSVPGLPDGIPIAGIAGDQQAALFGQMAFKQGDAKCTYGTGSFILMNTGKEVVYSKAGLLTTVGWQIGENGPVTYALEGGAFVCGAAVQWLRDGLGFIEKSSQVEELAQSVESSLGVEFVPALTGLGAPYWDPDARGVITGLTRGVTKAHVARATLEAMALQNVDILTAMEKDLGKKLKSLRVDGGASANNLLMQLQADYLGTKVIRPRMIETTSAGAAFLAGIGVGFWDQKELSKIWEVDAEFGKKLASAKRTERLKNWHRAIKASRL